jgi:RNA polymerase sigma-70 factor (ECF subfamily)
MSDRDSELVARCRGGDLAALEPLYRRHVDRVWRYAWFRTRSREASAEIVQETFLRVARSVETFEGRSAFSTWLLAVTRSVVVTFIRQRAREFRAGADRPMLRLVSDNTDPPARVETQDARRAVQDALMNLSGPHRDAITLCELSGLSIREAAEVLGWSESRVKTTLFRARRKLRDELKPYVNHAAAQRHMGTKGRRGAVP